MTQKNREKLVISEAQIIFFPLLFCCS